MFEAARSLAFQSLLLVVFYVFVVPIGYARRVLGYPQRAYIDGSARSLLVSREHTFSTSDFERTF